jgi:hypothetical protein
MKQLNVFIHVDADPDNDFLSGNRLARIRIPEACNQKWEGLQFTLRFLERLTDRLHDLGFTFRSTFFLRADEQIKSLYGTYSDAFAKFYDLIRQQFSVGWHPHLYRWSNHDGCWHQESNNNEWMRGVLFDCHDNLQSNGFHVQFSKMGWCFHNNATIKTISDLGLIADFSALPGARCPGRLNGKSFQDRYDWSDTDPKPYHPSENNYQKPGTLEILEVPLTTYQVSGPLVFLFTAKLAFESYIKFHSSYPISLHVKFPFLLPVLLTKKNQEKIDELMWESKESEYITLYFHPDELLDSTGQRLFEDFVFRTTSMADKKGIHVSFLDASDLYNLNRSP